VKKMARKKNNYINNKDLFNAVSDYLEMVNKAKDAGKQPPQITKYIGESILLICTNLAKKPNFSGYSYKDDMISDAIIDCVAAVGNFNPEKTNNPFAYFTQIAWRAFLRRINKEKKQNYVKHKNFENSVLLGGGSDEVQHLKSNEFSEEVIRTFENKLTKPAKSAKLQGLEKFVEETND